MNQLKNNLKTPLRKDIESEKKQQTKLIVSHVHSKNKKKTDYCLY